MSLEKFPSYPRSRPTSGLCAEAWQLREMKMFREKTNFRPDGAGPSTSSPPPPRPCGEEEASNNSKFRTLGAKKRRALHLPPPPNDGVPPDCMPPPPSPAVREGGRNGSGVSDDKGRGGNRRRTFRRGNGAVPPPSPPPRPSGRIGKPSESETPGCTRGAKVAIALTAGLGPQSCKRFRTSSTGKGQFEISQREKQVHPSRAELASPSQACARDGTRRFPPP